MILELLSRRRYAELPGTRYIVRMRLRPIYGHDGLLDRLGGALASGRFPQVTLLVGPPGVGKQRVALWVAQGLLCAGGPGGPCGTCEPCRRVAELAHPDLHWFVPIPRGKAADPARQVEEAREALGDVMAERRRQPLYQPPDRMASHAVASARLLRQVVALTPFLGRRKVVVVGDAERLIVQEASQEAANALLKVLEEPPADTTILLTAADPEALLPTIRSRAVPVRVGRVTDEAVQRFLESEVRPRPDRAAIDRAVALAEGCIGRTLWEADGAAAAEAARELLAAISRGARAWGPIALAQPPWSARGGYTALLDALTVELRERLKHASARGDAGIGRLLRAVRLVEDKRAEAQGNANPQLALAVLANDLEHVL
jgi:DNA polymerase-3 subunit delta'